MAYAITAHKCQGETLEEVIIDFGPDVKHKIKNYICPGSFYVALTRVREGSKVFLRSFDKTYIQVNKKIEEKVDAMIKYRSYVFKKVYLDQQIFEDENDEIKVGYLNINGLQDGNHEEYLNEDKNLLNLDILVLAETKLSAECTSKEIDEFLNNWNVIGRYDSEDGRKHMGLLLLSSKKSNIIDQIQTITHQTTKREGQLQIQGLIVRLKNFMKLGFLYSRSTPTDPEIKAINKHFAECTLLMGDFNLSHRISKDQLKIKALCQGTKISALTEITRSISNNQLDYILIDQKLKAICFSSSFNNFISDHKSITARIGLQRNQFSEEFKQRQTFDSESHLKSRNMEEMISSESSISDELNESNTDLSSDSLGQDENLENFEPQMEEDQREKNINSSTNQIFKR